MLIVGFNELRRLFPALIAQNINEQSWALKPFPSALNQYPIAGAMNATAIELAHAFEQDASVIRYQALGGSGPNHMTGSVSGGAGN